MTARVINLFTLSPSEGFAIVGDPVGYKAGFSVSSAGDVNGDGINDLLIGAPANSFIGDSGTGKAHVIFGRAEATRADIDLTALASGDGFVVVGDALYDQAGFSVSSAGDVNDDGVDDLIIGAPFGDDGGSNAGEAYVIFGKSATTRADVDLSVLSATDGFVIVGDEEGDTAGVSVSSAGDVNGDGIDDIIVGALRGDDGGSNAGEAYVIFGKSATTRADIDLSDPSATDGFVVVGDNERDHAGVSVSSAGDVNDDGVDDLIIGAPFGDDGGSNAGEVYVIFGKSATTRADIDLSVLSATYGFVIAGGAANEMVGSYPRLVT